MKSNEQTPEPFVRPSPAQELIDKALAYIEADGTVVLSEEDGTTYHFQCFDTVGLDVMTDESWLRTLVSVAWVLFRDFKHQVLRDEDRLKVLALYLGAYRYDKSFLYAAASLMPCDEKGWLKTPRLPEGYDLDEIAQMLRMR